MTDLSEPPASAAGATAPAETAPSATPTLESLLDAAAMVLQNGGSAAMADGALKNLAHGFGRGEVAAVWRLDGILATGREEGRPVTLLRPIGPVGLSLARASEVTALSERVAKGDVDAATFAAELERIRGLPPPYGRWVMALAAAFAGLTFSRTMAGDQGALILCPVAAGVGQLLRSQLTAWKFSRTNTTFVCALLSGLIAAAGLDLGVSQTVGATFLSSIIYAVPGVLLINGFLDLLTERFLIIGLQRLAHAGLLFLILAIAVAVADSLTWGG
jgi:uncharacterized membrane protein YjjP (DUF1212 family)